MSEKIASQHLTNDIHLIAVLCELESCRLNEIPKHKVSLYRNGLHYNVNVNHEMKQYQIEINNDKAGAEKVDNSYTIGFGFKAEIKK